MQRITVTGTAIQLISGILELTPEQAAARSTALDNLGEGLYLITAPVQFKRGETIGYDGEVSKALTEEITPLEVEVDIPATEPTEETTETVEEVKTAKGPKTVKSIQDSL